MKPYPKYKDSGIEWIGEVPEHWRVEKLKWIAKVRLSNIDKKSKEGELAVELCNYVDVYYNDNITSDIEFMKATARQDQIDIFSLKEGDILITKDSETPDDIAVPAFVSSSLHDVVCGYHLAHIRPYRKYADGNYLFRSFGAHGISDQFEISANGVTRFGIGKQAIDNSVFLTPTLEEQTAISAYLDRKTAQIDNLISKKQKLIELLKEERAAIINQAVTKGLNPDAPMKDSGIEWIGEVPEGWEVKKLKWLAKVRLSNIDKKTREGELTVELCNYIDVYYNDNITSDIEFMKATARKDQIDILFLAEGDVLITKDSELPDDIAVPAFVPSSLSGVVCGYHLAHVRPYQKHADGNYLFWSFSTHGISDQFEISANGVTRFGIGKQAIDNSVFLSPPLVEQTAIAAYLNRKTTKIDQTTSKIENQIDLLQEYRTALISEVVTGKIDVRDKGSNG